MYPQSMFGAKIRKISKIFSWNFSIFKAKKISMYCIGKFWNTICEHDALVPIFKGFKHSGLITRCVKFAKCEMCVLLGLSG